MKSQKNKNSPTGAKSNVASKVLCEYKIENPHNTTMVVRDTLRPEIYDTHDV